jgi:hypothetical protein
MKVALMKDKPKHLEWLVDTGERVPTAEGRAVEVWEFRHQKDEEVLSQWAKHFRNHYCLDDQIDDLRSGTGYSRADYLRKIKLPDEKAPPGPSIRAGDFGEILVADYVEYILDFWVPRTRYIDKAVRNESTKGSDILGFHVTSDEEFSPRDALAIFEVKAQFSGTAANPRLQDAIDGSMKDQIRKSETLNAMKQRFLDLKDLAAKHRIERFQSEEDNPYQEISGAAALFSSQQYDPEVIHETSSADHPNNSNLVLLVIRGDSMMELVHELYRRVIDEA